MGPFFGNKSLGKLNLPMYVYGYYSFLSYDYAYLPSQLPSLPYVGSMFQWVANPPSSSPWIYIAFDQMPGHVDLYEVGNINPSTSSALKFTVHNPSLIYPTASAYKVFQFTNDPNLNDFTTTFNYSFYAKDLSDSTPLHMIQNGVYLIRAQSNQNLVQPTFQTTQDFYGFGGQKAALPTTYNLRAGVIGTDGNAAGTQSIVSLTARHSSAATDTAVSLEGNAGFLNVPWGGHTYGGDSEPGRVALRSCGNAGCTLSPSDRFWMRNIRFGDEYGNNDFLLKIGQSLDYSQMQDALCIRALGQSAERLQKVVFDQTQQARAVGFTHVAQQPSGSSYFFSAQLKTYLKKENPKQKEMNPSFTTATLNAAIALEFGMPTGTQPCTNNAGEMSCLISVNSPVCDTVQVGQMDYFAEIPVDSEITVW